MRILHLLEAQRAASSASECRDDEGPFFDLDFSSCSVCTCSSYSSASLSGSDSDDVCTSTELDFIISLHRSSSASFLFSGAPPLKFCASDPPARANSLQSQRYADRKRRIRNLRSLSFGARKTLYGSGRHSFARSSKSSGRSFRQFGDSTHAAEDDEHHAAERTNRRAPSRDVISRCLAKISRRLRTASASSRAAEARGLPSPAQVPVGLVRGAGVTPR